MRFTAVYKKAPEGYIGFVQELPGANTQGKTLEETRANLQEAIEMTLEANHILAEESIFKNACSQFEDGGDCTKVAEMEIADQ